MPSGWSYQELAEQPLIGLRQRVATLFYEGALTGDGFPELGGQIAALVSPGESAVFAKECAKAEQALATGQAPDAPVITTPELQLLWGVALATLACDEGSDVPVQKTPLWTQIIQSHDMQAELLACGLEVASGLRRTDLTIGWSGAKYPDVHYYCDTKAGYINLDPVWGLIGGLEPARAAVLHEVAHGLGSNSFTPKQQAVYDAMQIMREESVAKKAGALSPEEYILLEKLQAQFKVRHLWFDEAENSYANRFAVNRSQSSAQDFGQSLNRLEAGICNIPKALATLQENAGEGHGEAMEKFLHLKRAVRYSFYKNNDFFPNTAEGWRSIGVEPDWIEQKAPQKRSGMAALEALTTACQQLEALQPQAADRLFGPAHYNKRTEECTKARNLLIDTLFDQFVAHLLPEIEQQAEQQAQAAMDNAKAQQAQKGQGEKGQGESGQEGQEQEGSGQEGPDQDGQGQEGQGQDSGEGEGQEQGEGQGQPSGNTVNVEGVGAVPDAGQPGRTPQEARGITQEMVEEAKKDAQSLSDLQEQAQKEQQDQQLDQTSAQVPKNIEKPNPGQDKIQHCGTGKPAPLLNATPAAQETPLPTRPGDYNAYLKIIAPHGGAIKQAAKVLEKMQERLSQRHQDPATRRSLVPDDGDITRFDGSAVQDRLIKQQTGQPLEESDFDAFRVDGAVRVTPAPAHVEIWIDGSGSMNGAPVDMAVTTACILYEAARKVDIPIYIAMLGNPKVFPMAGPGMNNRQVGESIERMRKGMSGDNDFLAPALRLMLDRTVADRKNTSALVGNTHVFVISDGGFSDELHSVPQIEKMAQSCPHLTMDFVLIGAGRAAIVDMTEALTKASPKSTVGQWRVTKADQIHDAVLGLLNKRLTMLKAGDALSLRQKQREFAALQTKLYGRGN